MQRPHPAVRGVPITVGSNSKWRLFAGMIARPRATCTWIDRWSLTSFHLILSTSCNAGTMRVFSQSPGQYRRLACLRSPETRSTHHGRLSIQESDTGGRVPGYMAASRHGRCGAARRTSLRTNSASRRSRAAANAISSVMMPRLA